MGEVLYEGKSKLVYRGEDENSILIRYKDTASAFNGERRRTIGKETQC